jgi:translocation and assembly module TamA
VGIASARLPRQPFRGRLARRAVHPAIRARHGARAAFHDILLRGELGAVWAQAREGIPSTFLFRTGGDQTLRGYAFESLGVRRGNAIVGGRYLAVASAEYIHWVAENWGIAGFADGGNAWDGGRLDPVFGYGVGARFRTPIGPVRADLAYGSETGRLRLHFSVGFTF